jgi:hypothetical protein
MHAYAFCGQALRSLGILYDNEEAAPAFGVDGDGFPPLEFVPVFHARSSKRARRGAVSIDLSLPIYLSTCLVDDPELISLMVCSQTSAPAPISIFPIEPEPESASEPAPELRSELEQSPASFPSPQSLPETPIMSRTSSTLLSDATWTYLDTPISAPLNLFSDPEPWVLLGDDS